MDTYVLKDELFNHDTLHPLVKAIKMAKHDFNSDKFTEEVISTFPSLELKERVTAIRKYLKMYLSDDYYEATKVLRESLKYDASTGNFVFASYSEYVEFYGCTDTTLQYDLNLLGEFTKVFSAEFSIRRFINSYPKETFTKMMEWAKSENSDQRRLASEGLRPKLPWAMKINYDYLEALKPLDYLYYDKDRSVVRSVANHLNDVSKINPDLVVDTLDKWQKTHLQEDKEMLYLINHSLRTSIKKGHVKSLEFIGYHEHPKIEVSHLKITNDHIKVGKYLEFSFDIHAKADEKLMVDFKIKYPMANDRTSYKVFKLKKIEINKNESLTIKKKHGFKVMTTKKLYEGDYALMIQINGKIYAELPFKLSF